nr:DUF2752 domain-containing protein [uncultured Acetatifactor sp.]
MKKQKTLEDQLYFAGWFLLIGGIAGIFVYFQFIMPKLSVFPCFFYHVLGIYCPGCGGTRAIGALLQGKPLLSFWYHPLVPYTVVLFGGFMLTQTLERVHFAKVRGWRFHNWHMYGAVVLLTANWIIKNLLLHLFHVSL